MSIRWNDKLKIGNTWIDNDHRYLFCLINAVEFASRTNEDEFLLYTLDQLMDYTREHFKREEAIMIKTRYVRYDQHRMEHQDLLESLEVLRARFAEMLAGRREGNGKEGGQDAGKPPAGPGKAASIEDDISALLEGDEASDEAGTGSLDQASDVQELVDLLRRWVLGHVLKTDREMISTLKKFPASLA